MARMEYMDMAKGIGGRCTLALYSAPYVRLGVRYHLRRFGNRGPTMNWRDEIILFLPVLFAGLLFILAILIMVHNARFVGQ
jgi:hypothetical protein